MPRHSGLLLVCCVWVLNLCPPAMGHSSVPEITQSNPTTLNIQSRSCTPLTPEERVEAYGDLGHFHHEVIAYSPVVHKLFSQGLLLEYNFNQAEARRSFLLAAQLDPQCVMCHWGVAYSLGPYANKVAAAPPADSSLYPVFTAQEREEALEALAAAEAAASTAEYQEAARKQCAAKTGEYQSTTRPRPQSESCSRILMEKEKAYLRAIKERYTAGGTFGTAWEVAERQYVRDMQTIGDRYHDDADAYALAAEAAMNLSPWDFYNLTTKLPNEVAQLAEPLVRAALQRQPAHPLATHLYVHLTEGVAGRGPNAAGRAEAAADVLGSGTYLAMGHLTHMASHNYIRVGRWHDGVAASLKAVATDRADAARCLEPYDPQHNMWMLLHAAATGGEFQEAERRARELRGLDEGVAGRELLLNYGTETSPLSLLWTRYGRWDDIRADVAAPRPGDMVPEYQEVMYWYSQLMATAAFARKLQQQIRGSAAYEAAMRQVEVVLGELEAAAGKVLPDVLTKPGQGLGIYSGGWHVRVGVCLHMAAARVAGLKGDWGEAERLLLEATVMEASAGYVEPPREYQPVRQCLGWVLLQQGNWEEAVKVYEEDLQDYPENAWSLKGLKEAYLMAAKAAPVASERTVELARLSADAKLRLDATWKTADAGLVLYSSCPSFSAV